MAKNMKLDDEMMNQVNGGTGEELYTPTITGIVMVDPRPDDPAYAGVWEECQSGGYAVYTLSDDTIAVASSDMPAYTSGDRVFVNHIRGFYGYEIVGVMDGK